MIHPKVLPHYEKALAEALNAPADEITEMYLNQARGMAEYAFLIRDLSNSEFEQQTQRQNGVRTQRSARRNAGNVPIIDSLIAEKSAAVNKAELNILRGAV